MKVYPISRRDANAVIVSLLVYIGLHLVFAFQKNTSICHDDHQYATWIHYCLFAEMIIFYSNSVLQLFRLINIPAEEEEFKPVLRTSHVIAALISVLAGTSSLFQFAFGFGGLCSNNFEVVIPLTIWVEWLVCVPLMAYLSVSSKFQSKLTTSDTSYVTSLGLTILFGFIASFNILVGAEILFLALSCFANLAACKVAFGRSAVGVRPGYIKSQDALSKQLVNDVVEKKELSKYLLYVLPPFPLLYFLRAGRVIDNDVLLAGLIVANVVAKFLFTSRYSLMCFVNSMHDFDYLNLLSLLNDRATDLRVHFTAGLISELRKERDLNSSRREFMRYIFHELRVPLNSLTMGIEVLSSVTSQAEKSTVVMMMKEASSFMSDTLNDVLSITKIEENAMDLNVKPFVLFESIKRAVYIMQNFASSKSVSLVTNTGPVVEFIETTGDRFIIEHVITNLVSNAIKFSEPGNKVTVSCGYDEINKETVLPGIQYTDANEYRVFIISVSDEGCGIAPEDIHKLFTPFQQIRPDDVQKSQGTGLGLALSKARVELVDGTLTCESTVGIGTTFTIRVPMKFAVLPRRNPSREVNIPSVITQSQLTAPYELDCLVVDGIFFFSSSFFFLKRKDFLDHENKQLIYIFFFSSP